MPLFALTLLVSSALLFCIQPMAAKRVLPLFGGSPAVWTACMLFFQAVLLAGYGYAHAAVGRLGLRRQAGLHAALALLSLGLLPTIARLDMGRPLPTDWPPTARLLGLLTISVGLPTFVLATTAPLLQRWYAGTGRRGAHDPYFLYVASNTGSLAALLAYPLLIEPNLRLERQATLWAAGYGVLGLLIAGCAALVARSTAVDDHAATDLGRPEASRWLGWLALAFVPSSLMLGVTTYLSTDIAPVPLLWVVPLALYLLTFIIAFARRPVVPHRLAARALPIVVMILVPVLGVGMVQAVWIPLHLLGFFLAALVCHGELARRRPPAGQLTAFYLALAVGGALGGLFNALVAPRLFNRVAEYPLALVLACFALPAAFGTRRDWRREAVLPLVILVVGGLLVRDVGGLAETVPGALALMLAAGLAALVGWTYRTHPLRFALGVGSALLALGLSNGVDGRALLRERNFFGVLRVTQDDEDRCRRLFHGSTLHGQQSLEPGRTMEPQTYFSRPGPIGDVFAALAAGPSRPSVAVAGLGAGSLACYATPDQGWTFFEIDPAVVRIAENPRYFTFLRDTRAGGLHVVLGDARLKLAEAPAGGFGLIVLDAFSSDALPAHLLTREALRLYLDRLADGGLIAVNISNRYLDLDALVGVLARDAGLACRVRYDVDLSADRRKAGALPSAWAVLARRESDLGPIAADPAWVAPRDRPGATAWTDDFSNLAEYFVLGGLKPRRGASPAGRPASEDRP